MNIAVLDYKVIATPEAFKAFHELGTVSFFENTAYEDIVTNAQDADVIITNKCKLDENIIRQLPKLK